MKEGEGKGKEGRKTEGRGRSTFLPHPLPPLLLAPFFARSSTLVPRSLLRNQNGFK